MLFYIVVALAIIAIAQLIRVFELAGELKSGQGSEQVTEADNRFNSRMWMIFMIAFFGWVIWQVAVYGKTLLPVSASEHGVNIDWLWDFNMIIVWVVFFIVNAVLFMFAFKYFGKKGRTATFYPHNNKLELLWTVVPGIVLFVIIFLGLRYWNEATEAAPAEATVIELYAKQFDWTARYSGKDNTLGKANYRLITGVNDLGMDSTDQAGKDDIVVKSEFHIPKGKPVEFKFRSRDVIHSAFMPHFRAQMNCVPGMVTRFHFTPRLTTKEMKEITKNEKFDYILLCNKICGASHYNMQMTIIVDEPADYEAWIAKQKTFYKTASAVEPTSTVALK